MKMTALRRYQSDLATAPNPDLELVVEIASQYAESGLPLEELIAEGNVGLAETLHLVDTDALEKPFAMEAAARINAHIEEAVRMHSETGTFHGALEHNSAALNDVADDMPHGQLQEVYDEVYELWTGLKTGLETNSHRSFAIFLYCYGIGEPFPETCEEVGLRFNLKGERVRLLLVKATELVAKRHFWIKWRPSVEAVGVLLEKYYHDPAIFDREKCASNSMIARGHPQMYRRHNARHRFYARY